MSKDQYKDSSKLSARADLHQRFSSNTTGWHQWVFDQLDLPVQSRILEIGAGPGYLWQQNLSRLQDWEIYLSDLSEGMNRESKNALGGLGRFRYAIHDACNIPFPESTFDAVIANHMIYHIIDIPAALREVKRVLKPGRCLYAGTNGKSHLQEILSWRTQFFPDQNNPAWGTSTDRFSLENGESLLQQEFMNIRLLDYPDSLSVDEVEPIIRYIRSYSNLDISHHQTKDLRDFLKQKIKDDGSIKITKKSVMFAATKH